MEDINIAIKGVNDALCNLFAHIVKLSTENTALRQELALRYASGAQLRTTGIPMPTMSRQLRADLIPPVPSLYGMSDTQSAYGLTQDVLPSYTGSMQLDSASRLSSIESTLNDMQKRIVNIPIRTIDKLTPTQIAKLGLRPGQSAELGDTIPQLNDKLKVLFLQAGIVDEALQRQLLACYPVHFAAKAQ